MYEVELEPINRLIDRFSYFWVIIGATTHNRLKILTNKQPRMKEKVHKIRFYQGRITGDTLESFLAATAVSCVK